MGKPDSIHRSAVKAFEPGEVRLGQLSVAVDLQAGSQRDEEWIRSGLIDFRRCPRCGWIPQLPSHTYCAQCQIPLSPPGNQRSPIAWGFALSALALAFLIYLGYFVLRTAPRQGRPFEAANRPVAVAQTAPQQEQPPVSTAVATQSETPAEAVSTASETPNQVGTEMVPREEPQVLLETPTNGGALAGGAVPPPSQVDNNPQFPSQATAQHPRRTEPEITDINVPIQPAQSLSSPIVPQDSGSDRSYSGPTSGTIIWSGKLPKEGLVTIEGNHASTGLLNGELPGVPIIVTVEPKDIGLADSPGPQNGWKRLALRSKDRRHSVITITWEIIR